MLRHFSLSVTVAPFPHSTEREHEVLRLLAGGADNATIGRRLGVSGRQCAATIQRHY